MSRLLVVVDIQGDFADGALGSSEAQATVPHMLGKVKAYQDAGDEVISTPDVHFNDYMGTMEGRKFPVVHRVKGTSDWELVPKLRGASGTRFEEHIFGSRELVDYTAGGRYDFVELVDLCVDICIMSNTMLLKAVIPDTSIQMNGACCTGVTSQSHHNILNAVRMCHVDIVQTWKQPWPCRGYDCGLGIRGVLSINDKHSVTTIERQCGSGDCLAGKRLAEELGVHSYDEEVLKTASETSTIEEQYFRLVDEGAGNNLLYCIVASTEPELMESGKDSPNIISSENLLHFQSSVIRGPAASEIYIIVGRYGNYVLQDQMGNLVCISMYADTVTRARRVMDVDKVDEAGALHRIRRTDRERTEYHCYFTDRE